MCNYPDTKHIRNKQSIIHLDNKSIIRSGTRLKSHILHHVQHTVSLHLHICAYLGTLIRRIKLVQVSIYFSDLPTYTYFYYKLWLISWLDIYTLPLLLCSYFFLAKEKNRKTISSSTKVYLSLMWKSDSIIHTELYALIVYSI